MPNEVDNDLTFSLVKLDINNNVEDYATLLGNPLYEPYDNTDMNLLKNTRRGRKMRVNLFKKKHIQEKPYLRRLETHTQEKGKNWLEACIKEMQDQITWVKYDANKSKRSFNMKDLNNECSDIAYSIDPAGETPLKKMSVMAESMYN